MKEYEITDWHRILFGELPEHFLLEVGVRTLVMFVIIFISLRLTGKTTVRQLTVVDLVLIVGLGSAAGDPMFYNDVGLLPALLVFGIVIIVYRNLNKWAASSTKAADLVVGRTILLIEDGQFAIDEFKKEQLGQDEFFMELREGGAEHLGQIRRAYLESSGNVSLFFYEADQVKWGLPILPELFCQKSVAITQPGIYACSFCGQVQTLPVQPIYSCPTCQHNEWVKALNRQRVT